MLKIHQPYIKRRKVRMTFAFASIGVLLLASGIIIAAPATHPSSHVYAAGDSRTIHDISDMQDMTQQICSNTDIGDTETLIDNRSTKIPYKIIKMNDGTCWMAENLTLNATATEGLLLTPDNTDIASNWTLPKTLIGSGGTVPGWDNSKIVPYSATLNNAAYGTYYNWYSATAETNTSITANNTIASGSICPKNWALPSYDGAGSFYNITTGIQGYKSNWTVINGVNGYKLGYDSDDAFWPAAGSVGNGFFGTSGSNGYYWSRKAHPRNGEAYYLSLSSSQIDPQGSIGRYNGLSVRCVILGGLDKIEKPIWSENENSDVTVTMPSIISIDATSGMSKTADNNTIAEGTVTATISSNTEHAITIHSTQPSLKDPKVTTAEISPVSSSNPVQPGHNAWGFWDGTGDANNKSYTLPITTTPQDLYNSTETVTNNEGNPATKHTYYVGISISPALPSGTYATDVVITASTK